jgi:hypothetical protein
LHLRFHVHDLTPVCCSLCFAREARNQGSKEEEEEDTTVGY